ncbi:MAG: Cation transport ATPase [Candidatus Methanohalarchaeum thermophilum]|uniref:Cation transport ATPase n=1 Tax=Methanohalarchaeum thermophilum TaxID=1903181 RepID=A0A1Q6DT65_METT1|nr:MAG: Cation transport ATPase [Candidatus Methanohalarchaeum thermophilum]
MANNEHKEKLKDFKKRFYISLILTAPILLLSPTIQSWFNFTLAFNGRGILLLVLASIIYLYGGYPFLSGIYRELRDKSPGMMTLIAVAISVAYLYSATVTLGLPGKVFYWELATLIDVMLLGHWIEMKSILSASQSLKKLAKLMPSMAHLIKGDKLVDVKISSLSEGDRVLVKPGEKIPADGEIRDGEGYVNESMLTGESKPIKKKSGDEVFGGSINGDTSLEVEVTAAGDQSYLSEVINLVEEAQSSKSRTQRLADKAAFYLTIIALTAGALTLISWTIVGKDLVYAIERMATVMVITCPHALGLAIPLVTAVSTTLSAQNGLLIRDRTAFENSRKITTILFDKTGTLTKGVFEVTEIFTTKEFSDRKLLRYAASLERESEHPIADGIIKKAEKEEINYLEVSDFQAIKGEGIKGKVDGKKIEIVGPNYLRKKNIKKPEKLEPTKLGTVVYLVLEDKLIGGISLSDIIREESKKAISDLKEKDISCWMITGDTEEVAKQVSQELEMDGYFAEVLPHEKQEKIKELQDKGEFVAMTGDGINDAPALAQANIGIAIGSGTDIAAETADIILVNSNPLDVKKLILFGQKTYKKIIQNLFWATGYNAIAIPLAAGALASYNIILPPAIGALLMSISTVIVAANAKLLKP